MTVADDAGSPPPDADAGVECREREDRPDPGFVDSNCDGIDGDSSRAIFVAPDGSDDASGTKAEPVQTVGHAIALAQDRGHRQVYIAAGVYEEPIDLPSGISLYGGYEAGSWSRSTEHVTKIYGTRFPGGSMGLTVPDVSEAMELQLLHIEAPDVSGVDSEDRGLSTYAVRVLGGEESLTIRHSVLLAGRGARGRSGSLGDRGAPGGDGDTSAFIGPSGAGSSPCGNPGGGGGNGAYCANGTYHGSRHGKKGPGPLGGDYGRGGMSYPEPQRGGIGDPGDRGDLGPPGAVVARDRLFQTHDGLYLPANGHAGGLGKPGGGGGGGGGGGIDVNCPRDATRSGPGGGGGGGGCPGTGGGGGKGGGGSFALWVTGGNVSVEATELRTRGGGHGGGGGYGGLGGVGGDPGPGGPPATSHGAPGGDGGKGGRGGRGGYGSGGAGGASIGAVLLDGELTLADDVEARLGPGGAGGDGPENAPDGPTGLSQETLDTR